MKTGDKLPPCAGFTIHALPGNKAVLFGGFIIDEKGKELATSDSVFVISFTDSCVVSYCYYFLMLSRVYGSLIFLLVLVR